MKSKRVRTPMLSLAVVLGVAAAIAFFVTVNMVDANTQGYLIFGLDSLSYGEKSSHPGDMSAPFEATVMKALPGWHGEIAGITGQTLNDAINRANGDRGLLAVLDHAPSGRQRWIVLIGGTNDLARDHVAATEAQARMTKLCTLIHDHGGHLVVTTVLPLAPNAPNLLTPHDKWDVERNKYNTWLRTEWFKNAEKFADVAIDARLADPTNRRYYADDGMHLTDEGYTAMGEIVAGVLAKNGE